VNPTDLMQVARDLMEDSLAAKPDLVRRILAMCQET